MSVSQARFRSIASKALLVIAAVLVGGNQPVIAAELEEIVVTAQKREQSLEDVPFFVSVISGETLDASNIRSFSEFSKIVPGIVIDGPADGLGSTIRIRGIGVTRNIEGIRPSVGIIVDDISLARIDYAYANFSDIASVEVLKGPQATLFGKEVSSGAIIIHTKQPHTDEVEGNLEVNLGNFDSQEYRGAINVPMGSATAARFSGYWSTRDGEIENVVTGKTGYTETWGARMSLLRKIADNAQATLTLERHKAEVRSSIREKVEYGQYELAFAAAGGVTLLPTDKFDRKAQVYGGDGRSQTVTNAALHLSWDINDAWSLVSVTGYQKFVRDNDEGERPEGVNYTSNDLFGTFTYLGHVNDKVLSQELRFTYEGDSLSSVMGVYYEDAELNSITDILVQPRPAIRSAVQAYGDRQSEDLAIFSHNIYKFNDRWTLTAGLRYSEVTKDDRVDNLRNVGAFGTAPAPIVQPQKDKWSSVSGTAKLAYQVKEDLTVYGGYDRGFKAGGHNTLSSGLPKFDEEIADNLEVGMKGMFFDRRLRWAVSAFDMKYKDFQVNSPSTTSASSYIQNAAAVDVSGVETEFTWMVTDKFVVDGALAYIDSKYGDFKYAECTDQQKSVSPPGCTQDLTGRDVNGNSPLTWNLAAQYDSGLYNTKLNWYLRGELAYRDELQGTSNLDPRTVQDAYTLVNASVGLSPADGAWALSFWGKNLTNEDYVSAFEIARSGLFGLNAELGDSRTYGVNFKYNF